MELGTNEKRVRIAVQPNTSRYVMNRQHRIIITFNPVFVAAKQCVISNNTHDCQQNKGMTRISELTSTKIGHTVATDSIATKVDILHTNYCCQNVRQSLLDTQRATT
jgi:hypothetical protein